MLDLKLCEKKNQDNWTGHNTFQCEIANSRGAVKGTVIECIEYKYLGVILSTVSRFTGDE